jgi:hypothetical protein
MRTYIKRLHGIFEKELISKAKKVLALQRKGIKLIFPDVLKIEKELMKKLDKPLNVDLSTETAVENLPNR